MFKQEHANNEPESQEEKDNVAQQEAKNTHIEAEKVLYIEEQIGETNNINYYTNQVGFEKVENLKSYEEVANISSEDLANMKEMLKKEHFLILGGGLGQDKEAIALNLINHLTKQDKTLAKQVYRWTSNTGFQDLDYEIRNNLKPSIFLVPQVDPQQIGYEILKYKELVKNKHFLVFITDKPKEAWKLGEQLSSIWFDLKSKKTVGTFISWFNNLSNRRQQLIALALLLFDGLLDDQFFYILEKLIEDAWLGNKEDLQGLDYCDLHELQTYFKLEETSSIDHAQIKGFFQSVRKEIFEKAIWKSHRRHLLSAIPVIEQILKTSTHIRHNKNNMPFVSDGERRDITQKFLTETISEIAMVSLKSVNHLLLNLSKDPSPRKKEIAARIIAQWRAYGRDDLMFEVFDTWEQMEETAKEKAQRYKNKNYQKKVLSRYPHINQTVAITLAWASLYDPPNQLSTIIQDKLIALADNGNQEVIDTLKQVLPSIIKRHLVRLNDQGVLHKLSKHKALLTTLARGIAIAYQDYSREVKYILDTWSQICQQSPQNRSKYQGQGRAYEYTDRDKILALVVLTYGHISYDFENNTISPEEVYPRVIAFQKEETQPILRKERIFLDFIILQIQYSFEKIHHYLAPLIANLSLQEKEEIVRVLTDQFIKERQFLEGGETVAYVKLHKGQSKYISNVYFKSQVNEPEEQGYKIYPIWMHGNRQKTTIEIILFTWLVSDGLKISLGERNALYQTAYLALRAFDKKFNIPEAQYIFELKLAATLNPEPIKQVVEEIPEQPDTILGVSSFYHKYFIRYYTAGVKKQYRPIMKAVLPMVLQDRSLDQKALKIMARNLHNSSSRDLEKLENKYKKLPQYLSDALNAYERFKKRFKVLLGILVVVILIILQLLLQ